MLAAITWERALFGSNGCFPLQIKLIFSKPASIYIYTDITYYSQTWFIKPNSTDLVNSNATGSVSTDPDGVFHWKLLKLLRVNSVIICFVFIAFIFSTVFFTGKDNPRIISHWQDTFSRILRVSEHWRIKHTLLRERWIKELFRSASIPLSEIVISKTISRKLLTKWNDPHTLVYIAGKLWLWEEGPPDRRLIVFTRLVSM